MCSKNSSRVEGNLFSIHSAIPFTADTLTIGSWMVRTPSIYHSTLYLIRKGPPNNPRVFGGHILFRVVMYGLGEFLNTKTSDRSMYVTAARFAYAIYET